MGVYLTGAHGTGKSTLLRALSNSMGLTPVMSPLKVLLQSFQPPDWRLLRVENPVQYFAFQVLGWKYMSYKIRRVERPITDRFVTDFIAYAVQVGRDEGLPDDHKELLMATLGALVTDVPDGVVLFFRWPGFNSPADGQKIDRIIEELLFNPTKELFFGDALCFERWMEVLESLCVLEVTTDDALNPTSLEEKINVLCVF